MALVISAAIQVGTSNSMADQAGHVMGCWHVHFLGLLQERVSVCVALDIDAVCRGKGPREVHNDPAVEAVLLGLSKEWVSLTPGHD